jgi:hypothetical protein
MKLKVRFLSAEVDEIENKLPPSPTAFPLFPKVYFLNNLLGYLLSNLVRRPGALNFENSNIRSTFCF